MNSNRFRENQYYLQKNKKFDRNIIRFQLILTIFNFERNDQRNKSRKYINVFVQLF